MKLPGESILPDGTVHEHHYIPGGYIYSPHNGDTGTNGHVYWTHYHAGNCDRPQQHLEGYGLG